MSSKIGTVEHEGTEYDIHWPDSTEGGRDRHQWVDIRHNGKRVMSYARTEWVNDRSPVEPVMLHVTEFIQSGTMQRRLKGMFEQ